MASTASVQDDFLDGVISSQWTDVAGATEARGALTLQCLPGYSRVQTPTTLDMRGSYVAASLLEPPTGGYAGVAPVADITSTVSQLRQGSLTGPRMVLAGIALWGIQDTIVGPDPLGDQWYAARDQIAVTLRGWGVNYVRIRVWADYYNGLSATDQAAYVAKAVAWRDAMKAQGILTCFCWWDPLDGNYKGAAWATNYNRSFALMAAIINAVGLNEPWTFIEPGNEPFGMTDDAWYTAMAGTITYLRSTLGYQNLLVIDPNNYAHTWDDTRFTSLENLDATLRPNGRANLIWAWHEYANNYSGQTWNTNTFTANTGGTSQRHIYGMLEFGRQNNVLADNVTWASAAATALAGLPATRVNFCGAAPFLFGNWYDNNAITTADLTTTTAWGTAAKNNFFANVGATRPQQSTTQALMRVILDTNNVLEMIVEYDAAGLPRLVCRQKTAGTMVDVSLSYDPRAHRWWRMSEAAGSVTWATSPDGAAWTVQRTAAAGFSLAAVAVAVASGYYGQAPSSPGVAQWGAFNVFSDALVGAPSTGVPVNLLAFISFDRDPLDCPLAVRTDATMEGANSWDHVDSGTQDVVTSIGPVHAGTQSMRLTRAGSTGPLQEFWQSAAGTVTPGRWYLALIYTRPDTTARTATITATVQTAALGTLATASGSITQIAGRWLPLAVPVLAPAGASRLRVDLTVPGVVVGEAHRFDTFTADHLGTLLAGRVRDAQWRRGRNDELGQVQASTCSLTLTNSDGYLTPDGTTAPSPYLGNIDSGRRLVLLRQVGGVYYPEWTGTTESWDQSIHSNGKWSEVQVQATDGFSFFGKPILPPLPAEIMLDKPDAYLRLNEPKGSTSAGSIAGDGGAAAIATSKFGSGGSEFGADNASEVLDTGKTSDDGQSWLSLNPSTVVGTQEPGNVLDFSNVPAANPYSNPFVGWTMEIWARMPKDPPAETMILYRSAKYGGGFEYHSGFQVELGTDGRIYLKSPVATLAVTAFGYTYFQKPTTIPITVTWDTAGGANGSVTLGTSFETTTPVVLAGSPFTAGVPDRVWVGGFYQSGRKTLQYAWKESIAHVAFWRRPLSTVRQSAHAVVGRSGGTSESEGNRIGGVADLAGWPVAWTRVDIGISDLMDRSWAAASALALIQDIAKQTSAIVIMDAAGKLVMRNRHARVNMPASVIFRAADGTSIAARDFTPKKDNQFVENSIRVSQTGGATTALSDAISIRRYGEQPADDLEVATTSAEEVVALGRWRVETRKDNRARVSSLSLQPGARAALWPVVLTLEVGDRVSVQGLPTLAPWQTLDAFVESIESRQSGGRNVEYTLGLSPWREELHQMGQMDTGTSLSRLGQPECRLGWY